MYTDYTFSYIKKLERDRRNRSELLKEAGKEKMSESRTDNRQKQALRTKELDFLLCDSIENDFRGFSIHYQPQIRTSSGTLYGAEALARWQCARYGNVGPEEFIPVLEENGRITFSNHAEKLDEIQVGRLFDRFYTVETASSGSTGLGLSIARALTEQMGGSITAEYQSGMILVHVHFPQHLL